MLESLNPQHKNCILLLAQCISKLPSLQRKVLARYYFEYMPLADIATSLGLSKIKACQILVETSVQLFLLDRRTPHLKKSADQPRSRSRIGYGRNLEPIP